MGNGGRRAPGVGQSEINYLITVGGAAGRGRGAGLCPLKETSRFSKNDLVL